MIARRSRFWVVGLVLLLGSPASIIASKFVLHEIPTPADWIFHGLVFIGGLALLDLDTAREVLKSVRFWRNGRADPPIRESHGTE